MKNIVKYVIFAVIAIVLISLIVVFVKNRDNKYERPNYDYIATVYHSVMKEVDAGKEYFYYIYKSNDNKTKYFYIKSETTISIKGSGKEKDVFSGSINSKDDLKKITNDIEKDADREAESSVAYTYLKEGSNEECVDIDELGNKMFD